MSAMVNVLIVDDSPTARRMLASVINAAPGMRVVGEAINGRQSIKLANDLRPDVILMDAIMPEMDGLEATREIMHATPMPIVVCSASLEAWETDIAFQAINAGALAVLQKPVGPQNPDHAAQVNELISTLRTMASVRVIHHWRRADGPPSAPAATAPAAEPPEIKPTAPPELVAIVASTGGPAAISVILRALPADFRLPIVVVQHIAPDFITSLASWLGSITLLKVVIAQAGGAPQPGTVHLAPANAHLRLGPDRRFQLDRRQNQARYMPSGDALLESVAQSYGGRAIGVVLTGMGDDGARGLRAMSDVGAFTIAQDEASSVVFGMPREAIALGAAQRILSPADIAQVLIYLSRKSEQP